MSDGVNFFVPSPLFCFRAFKESYVAGMEDKVTGSGWVFDKRMGGRCQGRYGVHSDTKRQTAEAVLQLLGENLGMHMLVPPAPPESAIIDELVVEVASPRTRDLLNKYGSSKVCPLGLPGDSWGSSHADSVREWMAGREEGQQVREVGRKGREEGSE